MAAVLRQRQMITARAPHRASAPVTFLVAMTLAQLAAGCNAGTPIPFVAPPSPPPAPTGTLKAGFARVDITPPPGGGLMGWGTEGYAARGHRQRLFARALVLQDIRGERFAFVGLDLGAPSVALHRRVAQKLLEEIGMGADRLLLGATHTHAAPSHFFAQPAFDELGSNVSGYDAALTDELVTRISRAVLTAFSSLQDAKAAWGLDTLWGFTRIRSFAAYTRNPPDIRQRLLSRFQPPERLTPRQAGVDATWGMLRVDIKDPVSGAYRRAGVMSIFAMHGTMMSSGLDLYDSDIQGLLSRMLEQRIDGGPDSVTPRAIAIQLNGGEGDVSPDVDPGTRCPSPMLVRNGANRGPRGSGTRTTWAIMERDRERRSGCENFSVSEELRLAEGMAVRAMSLYNSLDTTLSDTLTLDRAFRTIHLGKTGNPSGLCEPKEGIASILGAEDGYTRLRWNWPLLATDSASYPPNPGTPLKKLSGCAQQKRVFFGSLQPLLAGPKALPDALQLTLVRFGGIALIGLPGEPTSHSSWIARRAVTTALRGSANSADSVLMIGLANGYIHYIASPAEYPLQFYEGSATLYGPRAIEGISSALAQLATDMRGGNGAPLAADTIVGYVRGAKEITRWNTLARTDARAASATLSGIDRWADSMRIRWIGPHPAQFYGAEPTHLLIEVQSNAGWRVVAWDNLPTVSVYVDRRSDGRGAYSLRWWPRKSAPGPLRFKIGSPTDSKCWLLETSAEVPC